MSNIIDDFKNLLSKANTSLKVKDLVKGKGFIKLFLGDNYDNYTVLVKDNGDVIADDNINIGNIYNSQEELVSRLQENSITGGSAAFTPGTGMGVATKNAFGRFKPKKKKKKSYKLSSLLNEISYGKFKTESKTRNKSESLHKAVKEVKKRVKEINQLMEYTNRMRNELNEGGDLKYSRFTENAIQQISSMVAELYGNVKKLKK